MSKSLENLTNAETGIVGEYFVAAELSLRGILAAITLRNAPGVDIIGSLKDGTNISIQVKTTKDNKKWLLNKKVENSESNYHFFIFVSLNKFQRPDYHIVPSSVVAKSCRDGHANWLAKPGRNGKKRKDSDLRTFSDENDLYLENWEILTNII